MHYNIHKFEHNSTLLILTFDFVITESRASIAVNFDWGFDMNVVYIQFKCAIYGYILCEMGDRDLF